MTVARSVADVLDEHVVFEVERIDRMYCNVYLPHHATGLVGYVQRQLGLPIASPAPLAAITDRFGTEIRRSAETHGDPVGRFRRGPAQARPEKTALLRTEKRRDRDGCRYPWIVKSTGTVNHSTFSCVDADFGPFFPK